MHFVTRATPVDDIDGKSHKIELKSSRNYSTNYINANSYLWPQGRSHTYIPLAHESNLKKPCLV